MASNNDIYKVRKMWNIPQIHENQLKQSLEDSKFKFYQFATIPLLCKGNNCKFKETCSADPSLRLEGARCFVEVTSILTRFEQLCNHFGINLESEFIEDKDCVDVSMIRDIIDIEIQMLRVDNKIALSGDFMADHIAQLDKNGKAYYEEIVHPAMDFKLKLKNERDKTFSKLNATRKDKADMFKSADYSSKAMTLIDTIKQKAGVQDINFDNLDELENQLQSQEGVNNG